MAFSNDVVGGTTLLRPAIRSPNYVAGVSGWTINRDGTSEFAGGTFRGPVVVIDPSTGVVLASIGADGNISAQNFYATGDVIIGTLSVLSAITSANRGTVGRFTTTSALPAIPGGNTFADICWVPFTVDHTRLYAFHCSSNQIVQGNALNAENFTFNVIVNQPGGLVGTVLSTVLNISPKGASLDIHGLIAFSADGPCTLKLQGTNDSSSTSYTISPTNGFHFWVEDVGPLVSSTGGTGSPSGATKFTKQYFATVSDTFNGTTGNRENDANNLYTGQLTGRTNGPHENGLWVFPGSTIRSDLAGATIQSAQLYMYCTGSSGASGGCFLSYVANTSIPSSAPSTGSDGGNHSSNWPVPGWGNIDITSALSTSIISGSKNSVLLQDSGLSGSASFYGAGNASFRPYIQITYTV